MTSTAATSRPATRTRLLPPFDTEDLTVHIGTEIRGVQLHELDGGGIAEVRRLAADRCVVFLRDQHMTLEQQVEVGRQLGELHIHPAVGGYGGHPEVFLVRADETSKFVEGQSWHSDVSCDPEPPALSMLRVESCPLVGGDTIFSSMYRAFETLSPSTQTQLLGLTATHSGEVYRGRYGDDGGKSYPTASHPMVRTHPISGRRALYTDPGFTLRIDGMGRLESQALLKFLFDHVAYGETAKVRWRWTPNSVAIWDNRCVQHYAVWDYFPQTRIAYRVTTRGERPYL